MVETLRGDRSEDEVKRCDGVSRKPRVLLC